MYLSIYKLERDRELEIYIRFFELKFEIENTKYLSSLFSYPVFLYILFIRRSVPSGPNPNERGCKVKTKLVGWDLSEICYGRIVI